MQKVFQTLPAHVVDLDNAVVMTLASDIEEAQLFGDLPDYHPVTDSVVTSGKIGLLHNDTGETRWIHWGRTAAVEDVVTVVVDVEEITLPILQTLWLAGAFGGDYPEVVGVDNHPEIA